MNRHTAIVFLLVFAIGCGGDDEALPDGRTASTDAGPAVDAGLPTATAFVVAGDFAGTGVASTIAVPGLVVTQNVLAQVAGDDPSVRVFGDKIYIVNRNTANNVTILDATAMSLIAQIATGSNPQDVAVVGTKIYVASLAEAGVQILDESNPDDGVVDTIDLSSLDAVDGLPDCNALAVVGTTLYVACGVLDETFTARGVGKIAVIDTADDTLTTTVDLVNANPFGRLVATPSTGALAGDLLVNTTPSFADLTAGCLERVSTGAAPASGGCLIQGTEMGGYAGSYAYGADDTVWVAVTAGWDENGTMAAVHTYDAEAATFDSTPVTGTQRAFDLALCPTGHAVFADTAGGMRVYSRDGLEITTSVLDVGLPPSSGGVVCY